MKVFLVLMIFMNDGSVEKDQIETASFDECKRSGQFITETFNQGVKSGAFPDVHHFEFKCLTN